MHVDDAVPVGLAHREHHAVTEDAGVVDQDVEATEGLDRLLDHGLGFVEVSDVGAIDDGFATHALDLFDDLFGRALIGAGAIGGTAQVVDDDLGSVLGQHERMLTADASTGSGDDGDAAFDEISHWSAPCCGGCGSIRRQMYGLR